MKYFRRLFQYNGGSTRHNSVFIGGVLDSPVKTYLFWKTNSKIFNTCSLLSWQPYARLTTQKRTWIKSLSSSSKIGRSDRWIQSSTPRLKVTTQKMGGSDREIEPHSKEMKNQNECCDICTNCLEKDNMCNPFLILNTREKFIKSSGLALKLWRNLWEIVPTLFHKADRSCQSIWFTADQAAVPVFSKWLFLKLRTFWVHQCS